MSTTRRNFLHMLVVGLVAGPKLAKAAFNPRPMFPSSYETTQRIAETFTPSTKITTGLDICFTYTVIPQKRNCIEACAYGTAVDGKDYFYSALYDERDELEVFRGPFEKQARAMLNQLNDSLKRRMYP